MRHPFVAEPEDTLLLIVDMQKAMQKAVPVWAEVVGRVRRMLIAAAECGIPVMATEHYKKGLGETTPELIEHLKGATIFQKEHFSACLEDGFLDAVRANGRRKIVAAGMESHVCVLQTGLDLMAAGYQLQVVRNAVASRSKQDWRTALEILRDAGAVITSAEIVIFQWIRRANTDVFRKILPIVK